VESHHYADRKPTGGVKKPTVGGSSTVDILSLPNIAELIEYGEITIGVVRPVGCVAVATDEANCLAMLKRRDGETLAQLLVRLDLAVGNAFTEDIFIDEINPPTQEQYSYSHKRGVSTKKNVDTTSSRR
jgi:hypothetical protein